jgi:hypothetical protein
MLEDPISQQGNPNTFYEYLRVNNVTTYDEIIKEIIKRPVQRMINGYCIKGTSQLFNRYEYIRVDKRVEFFFLEVFFSSITLLSDDKIHEVLNMLPKRIHTVLLSKALLRDVWKISFLGFYDNNVIHKSILESNIPELSAILNVKVIYPS